MNKAETALVERAMKAMEAEISGSYGLGYPSGRKGSKAVLDMLSLTGTTWTMIDWHEGKQVHPLMGFGDQYVPETMAPGWQQGLWALCRAASKGKGVIAARIDYAARHRVSQLGHLYNRCQQALSGAYELLPGDWDCIDRYLAATWPTNAR